MFKSSTKSTFGDDDPFVKLPKEKDLLIKKESKILPKVSVLLCGTGFNGKSLFLTQVLKSLLNLVSKK